MHIFLHLHILFTNLQLADRTGIKGTQFWWDAKPVPLTKPYLTHLFTNSQFLHISLKKKQELGRCV